MKISKLKIENLFGIEQLELDGKSVELTGSNGVGKSSVLDAIREQEKREQHDTVYNYRNYVLNKDYVYEIRIMQKYFYIFAVLEYPGISEKSVEKISVLTGTNQNYIYPPEIIYNDDSLSPSEKFRIKLLLEYDEFWDDTILR